MASVWDIGAATVGVGVSTTIVVTLTDSAAIGDLVCGWMVVQSSGTLNSVTDTKGNTWTTRTAYTSGTSRYYFVDSVLTTALAIGDTISLVCSTGANRKFAVFQAINGQAASYFDQQGAGASGTSTTPSITTGTLAQADSVIIGCVYSSLSTLSVEDADYTWLNDAILDNRNLHSAYRIVNSTTADTYSPTISVSQSWDTNYIVYKLATTPPPSSGSQLALMGVG
jgi:hypothetical protein